MSSHFCRSAVSLGVCDPPSVEHTVLSSMNLDSMDFLCFVEFNAFEYCYCLFHSLVIGWVKLNTLNGIKKGGNQYSIFDRSLRSNGY